MKFIITATLILYAFQSVLCQTGAETRIIGGRPVRPNELPFMVSIQGLFIHLCGGSLITNSYVITLATCLEEFKYAPKMAVAGGHTFNIYTPRPGPYEQTRQLVTITRHPDYKDDNGPNNLAMAKTIFPFALNKYVMPIPLPPVGLTANAITTPAFIAGWGMTSVITGAYSTTLQKGVVPIHSRPTCEVALGSLFSDTDICAGVLDGKPAGCTADSGGPLALDYGKGSFELVGVYRMVQWPCGAPGKPAIFIDVSNAKIMDFIRATVNAPPAP